MAKPDPDTLFFKGVCNTMLAYGYPVRASVREYCTAVPDDQWFETATWNELLFDVFDAFRDRVHTEPKSILEFITDVTYSVQPGPLSSYRNFMRQFSSEKDMLDVWALAKGDEKASYAFAMYLLSVGYFQNKQVLPEIISSFMDAPFVLAKDPAKRREDYAVAMFGPVWQSLYMNEDVPDKDFIDLILLQRPAFVGRPQQKRSSVLLPEFTSL